MPETANPEHQLTSLLVRTMALLCVRHSVIEDIHAGLVPVTRIGDYTDVTVINADGLRIPWPEVSHFDDNAMRDLMRQVVNRLYTFEIRAKDPDFLERIELWAQVASRWDEPKLDPVEGILHRIYVIFEESDGRLWTSGTDMMAPSLESAEAFSDRLNETLGVDRTAWSALANRVFAGAEAPDSRSD